MREVSIKCKFNVFYTDQLMKVTESLAKKQHKINEKLEAAMDQKYTDQNNTFSRTSAPQTEVTREQVDRQN